MGQPETQHDTAVGQNHNTPKTYISPSSSRSRNLACAAMVSAFSGMSDWELDRSNELVILSRMYRGRCELSNVILADAAWSVADRPASAGAFGSNSRHSSRRAGRLQKRHAGYA